MKVQVKYPQVVINTIEVDIPESEIVEDMSFYEKFDLVSKYAKNIPSYDELDYHLCKSYSDLNMFELNPLPTNGINERI